MPEGFYFTVLSPKKKLYLFLHFQSPTSSLHGPANDTSYKKSDHTYNDDDNNNDNNIISKREKEKEKKKRRQQQSLLSNFGLYELFFYIQMYQCISSLKLATTIFSLLLLMHSFQTIYPLATIEGKRKKKVCESEALTSWPKEFWCGPNCSLCSWPLLLRRNLLSTSSRVIKLK